MPAIRAALKSLGYDDVYHYFSVLAENPRDSDMWVDAFRGKFEPGHRRFEKKDWDQLLGHCEVLNDTPCNVFVEELMEAYPDAKIILTVRDNVDQWYESFLKSLQPYLEELYIRNDLRGWMRKHLAPRNRCEGMEWKLVQHTFYSSFPSSGRDAYLKHNEKVRRLAKEQNRDLLEFNAKEGWVPLCNFLEKDLPVEQYPRLFEGEQAIALTKSMIKEADEKADANLLRIGLVIGTTVVAVTAWWVMYMRW